MCCRAVSNADELAFRSCGLGSALADFASHLEASPVARPNAPTIMPERSSTIILSLQAD